MGGGLPAGRFCLGAGLLLGVLRHVIAFRVRFRFCFRVVADGCGGVIISMIVGRRILVGLSTFLRAGLLAVEEFARFLVLGVFRRASLVALVLA